MRQHCILFGMFAGDCCGCLLDVFFLPEDLYRLLERLMFRSTLHLTKGLYTGSSFRATLELDDVDENNYSIFVLVSDRPQVSVVLIIWNKILGDMINPSCFVVSNVP